MHRRRRNSDELVFDVHTLRSRREHPPLVATFAVGTSPQQFTEHPRAAELGGTDSKNATMRETEFKRAEGRTPPVFWLTALRVLALALLSVGTAFAAPSERLAGTWTGALVKNGDALPVSMTFVSSGTTWSGTFGSDAQQAAGIPLAAVTNAGQAVQFQLRGDDSVLVFDGTLKDNALSGTFSDGKEQGAFHLLRDEHPRPALRTSEVTFSNGPTALAGTLILPDGKGRHPAIAFVHGSGPEGRFANRWLAQQFAAAGFVALIYDKRGVGASSGDWRTAGFEDLARDGAAGIAFLRSLPEVDAARVGVYGHSQGGSIVPLVDADSGGLAFVIASSAPGLSPAAVERYSVGNEIGIARLPSAERADAEAYVDAIVDVAYLGHPRAELDALAAKYQDRSWYFAVPPPSASYWSFSRLIAAYDPSAAWSRVKAPVLLIYGLRDERVPPQQSSAAIQSALRKAGNDRVSVKLYPEADHTFTDVEAQNANGWAKREADYASTMTTWAAALPSQQR